MIDQYQMQVMHYAKSAMASDTSGRNRWIFTAYEDANEVVVFASIDFEISLVDLYDKVDFSVP